MTKRKRKVTISFVEYSKSGIDVVEKEKEYYVYFWYWNKKKYCVEKMKINEAIFKSFKRSDIEVEVLNAKKAIYNDTKSKGE